MCYATCEIAMSTTSLSALLDAISGSEPSQGLTGAGDSVNLTA